MDTHALTELIITYRYWILIPLTFVEGPVVAFVSGILASAGYLNLLILIILFFVRDVGLDIFYYAMGYYGRKTRMARSILSRLKLTDDHLEEIRVLWARHPGKTMFFGKLSYGIASTFIVIAGMVRMPFGKFLINGVWVTVVQYGGLLFVGYYFGESLGGDIVRMVDNIQYVLAAVILAASVYYLFGWYARHKLEDKDDKTSKK